MSNNPPPPVLFSLPVLTTIDTMSKAIDHYNTYPNIICTRQEDLHEKLSPEEFELVCYAWALENHPNARVERGKTNEKDSGCDVFIQENCTAPRSIVVQAKCYQTGSNVGSEVVLKTIGAANMKNSKYSIIITSSRFTREARESAKQLNDSGNVHVDLLNGDAFWKELIKMPEYKKRMDEKKNSLRHGDRDQYKSSTTSGSSYATESSGGTSTICSTNSGHTTTSGRTFECGGRQFNSKIHQKIKCDINLHQKLIDLGITCFEDVLFAKQNVLKQIHNLANDGDTGDPRTKILTASGQSLKQFLNEEIQILQGEYNDRLETIKESSRHAKTLGDVLSILRFESAERNLFSKCSIVKRSVLNNQAVYVCHGVSNFEFIADCLCSWWQW